MVENLTEALEELNSIEGVDAVKGVYDEELFVEVEEKAVGKFFGKQRRMDGVERGLTARDGLSTKYALTAWIQIE